MMIPDCEDLDREPALYLWILAWVRSSRRPVTTVMAMPGIVRRASALPIVLLAEMTTSALLLAPRVQRLARARSPQE